MANKMQDSLQQIKQKLDQLAQQGANPQQLQQGVQQIKQQLDQLSQEQQQQGG